MESKEFVPTSRDVAVLRDLWLFRYVTTAQVSRLQFGHVKLAQRRLRVLHARRLVERFRADQALRVGFTTWWYRLSSEGATVIAQAEGLTKASILPPRRRPKTMGFLAHHALTTDFRIWLREGCVAGGTFTYRLIPSYEEVRYGDTRRRRVALSVPGHRRLLIPDSVFSLESGDERALFMLEIDRGTEPLTGRHLSSIERKLEMYRSAFESKAEEHYAALFGHEFIGFRVLCVVPDQKRLVAFLRLAERLDLVPIVWVTQSSVLEAPGDLNLKCWSVDPDGSRHRLTE